MRVSPVFRFVSRFLLLALFVALAGCSLFNRGKKGEVVFSEDTSALFKEMRVSRFYDADKNVLVYLVWSTKLIDGSPFNSVTAIPVSQ